MKRRKFIKLGLNIIGGLATQACTVSFTRQSIQQPLIYSGFDDEEGGHYLGLLNLQTQHLRSVKTSFRGHDVLPHPTFANRAILFGRRPEMRCCEVDFNTLKTREILASSARHFYGHGCYSVDHQYLFTTENDFNQARGVIGIRDASTFKQLGEFASYGTGPHDIQLMPDGKTLVIANGGIQTHPDYGRRKLNLSTMHPSLVYIDASSGKKLAEYRLPNQHLSIRHLLVTPSGDVGIALQYQGNHRQKTAPSLLAWQKYGQPLNLLAKNPSVFKPMKGYMADLAYSHTSNILLATSPRGNQLTLWDMKDQRHLKNISVAEPSGVFFNEAEDSFVVSNSTGQILKLDAKILQLTESCYQNPIVKWDNHMVNTARLNSPSPHLGRRLKSLPPLNL